MKKPPLRIALTGAAGQIGYALAFRIASGQMFGPDQPVILHLIEIEPGMKALEGVVMELEDSAFELLEDIRFTTDLKDGFAEVNWALLVGSVPRKAGMQRSDLLQINSKVFVQQGRALGQHAAADIRTLVVGNPCNTNCRVAMEQAPEIPKNQWFAMTRLDENRAKSQLAQKAQVPVEQVQRLCVWGNHSATMFPDFTHATIASKPATEIIQDENWLKTSFVSTVAERGAAIIQARGASSAASAANAVIDTVKSLNTPTPKDDFHSVAVCSEGQYDSPKGLITSLPVHSTAGGWEVVEGLELNDYAQAKIKTSYQELLEEFSCAQSISSASDAKP